MRRDFRKLKMFRAQLSVPFCCGLIVGIFTFSNDAAVTAKSSPSSTSVLGFSGLTSFDGLQKLQKGNIKVNVADRAEPKLFDNIQPEYYRGSGTSSSLLYKNRDHNRFNTNGGVISKPTPFTVGQRDPTGNDHDQWKVKDTKTTAESTGNRRINHGYYHSDIVDDSDTSSSTISLISSAGHHRFDHNGYGGNGEYYEGNNHDEGTIGNHNFNREYHHYDSSHAGISEYIKGYDLSHIALFAKSFLIPFAGATAVGLAAAFVTNPLLWQLGTATSVMVGKRKRRDLTNYQPRNRCILKMNKRSFDSLRRF